MEEPSDWNDGPDILNSNNFHLTDEQLEYKKKYAYKDNKSFKDLEQIKSLISEVHDSRGFVTLRGKILATHQDCGSEITHFYMIDYPNIAILVYAHLGNIESILFTMIRSKTSIRIPAPKLVIIEDENDCDN